MSEHAYTPIPSEAARAFCVKCGRPWYDHDDVMESVTEFTRFQYREAKRFLQDATPALDPITGFASFSTPSYTSSRWLKPDGSIWLEMESHLEFPENEYSLKRIGHVEFQGRIRP